MAVLAQGQPQRLGLTNAPDAPDKHIVFVKLTDTSLEALTNYIKHHANKTTKPTISFSHNAGTFTVPMLAEDGSHRQQKFNFSLSSIDEQNGPQGSFECLESRRPGSLESLGAVQDKVHVQASEIDAYTRFGERMSDVKKENEKRTTRYIDRTIQNGLVSTNSNKIVSRKHMLANKSFSTGRSSNDLNRYSHAHASRPSSSSSLINGCQPLNGTHPMLDRNKHKKSQNPEIMKRTLRERIVHLLAVRPYKKPELSDRMNRDGLREKEKKELFPLVKQVSIMKDNTYHLQRHIWNDVSEDWPFYTEEERQAFRRRKPQNLTPPGSDGSTGSSGSGHSSSSSHPASPQPSLKRPASASYLSPPGPGCASPTPNEAACSPAAKRKRVSNYVRQPMDSRLSPMSGLGRSPECRSPTMIQSTGDNVMSGESKTNAWLKSNQEHHQQALAEAAAAAAAASIPDPGSFGGQESKTVTHDFTTKFVRIANGEQRRLYKTEFNRDYQRYMVLHKQLDKVSQRFARLRRQLQQTPATSENHQRLKEMVVAEYRQTKDGKFKRDQEEFQYLHKKLAHIKQLVHDYDTKYLKPGDHRKHQHPSLMSRASASAGAS